MRIVLTEFVTLDGVSQGPGSPTENTGDGCSTTRESPSASGSSVTR